MLYEGTLKPTLTLKSRQHHQLLWLAQGILAGPHKRELIVDEYVY